MNEEKKYYTPDEIWRDIKEYERYYQVSNKGRVKRLLSKTRHGHIRQEKILKLSNSTYKSVSLCKNNCKKNFTVHRLVAQAFISNPRNLNYINHKDGNKHNNFVENLEWCTRLENSKHASDNKLVRDQHGEKNNMSILTKKEVLDIRSKIKNGMSAYKVHKIYYPYLHQQTIYGIKYRRIWNHI